ncbi:tripartite tricarboxylate transporter substrate binding protein [Ramlibacter henchirensis]|uniref:Tripartite tricarboxylate transporter substrate binding protein n=2 Tax=Ramlibacter henchirensis TaxID=204072 RepID=A0A4Z0BU76_9BURK|nr:tripartite tricarboxylate transporter substrate binding protein [Ramlibacter henchirensis]
MRAVAATVLAPYIGTADSQGRDNRPYRLILSIGAGSGMDTLFRAYAKVLSEELKAPVVVDNKPGADGAIAFRELARAGTDGHTFMAVSDSMLNFLPVVKPGVYDPKSLRPIVNVTRSTSLIITRADAKYRNLEDLLNAARQKPETVPFGTYALFYRITLARLEEATKSKFKDIPYKGTPANALNDLLGGTLDAIFYEAGGAIPLIESGRVKPLAIVSAERSPSLPKVPTVAESGYPGFSMYFLQGMGVHSGTPEPLVRQLEAAAVKAARDPSIVEYAKQHATEHYVMGADAFEKYVDKDAALYRDFVARSGIMKRLSE